MIFMFPGQGSQFVSMGKNIYDNFAVARYVFHEVDDILNKKLSKIMFEGSIENLTSTDNAQLALMVTSIATLRAIEYVLGKPVHLFNNIKYMAGHSVGECVALCASGALTLYEVTQLLLVRSQAMYDAVPLGYGGMCALIGGSLSDVENVVKMAQEYGICEIANDNCDGQVVVSGVKAALEKLPDLIKDTGIKKVIKLQVSGPFHSSLMSSACEKLQEFIESVRNMKMPSVKVVSNVSAREYTDCFMIKNLIAKQLVSRVRWRESILYMISQGCTHFIEVGAGTTLSGLVKRISSDVSAVSINTADCIDSITRHFTVSTDLVDA
ncbi:malonyl CoA-acyl carrier protein transacylase [Ehrlichia chaffeensis str. Heartland]|uniref:Malonyl CoA-acyl carrier protein transacylase n=1 Tax=Ehrlichia chaffeensis (strain ATCC CRL-10679 / Arkansas) TaxID=205920 RepID=Q2GHN5_EHRCR|nr:ACP S-malonyltransferase [Ehrlichia chaffeensis]ABD44777.1 malonyl CoA-acyl carrier protein transacylase [Ehrlichia chaffeensis str. Arkansas]AHX03360.1 malonyl CoA-acyl carrier protein transacylase [Ehrlichia chaffeensis str. Heartland]AHX05921.1 malonyl CoA-acyl carrier protein transacylase [Ehrlichia chaffeensis str. Jax]AHX06911.1 malonyl CoA-acyl carrier protein transacylase [Ehrlichia chaffeensis str. Liberty]AHX07475.1 malonyl CoA-acyl carrier protein transacylase [Ehrlichia chaffeen